MEQSLHDAIATCLQQAISRLVILNWNNVQIHMIIIKLASWFKFRFFSRFTADTGIRNSSCFLCQQQIDTWLTLDLSYTATIAATVKADTAHGATCIKAPLLSEDTN